MIQTHDRIRQGNAAPQYNIVCSMFIIIIIIGSMASKFVYGKSETCISSHPIYTDIIHFIHFIHLTHYLLMYW